MSGDPLIQDAIKSHIDSEYKAPSEPTYSEDVTALQNFLSVEKPTGRDMDYLKFIKDSVGADSIAETLHQVRMIERRLTPPKLGQRRLDLVYGYLKAKAAATQAQRHADSYLEE